MRRSPPVLLAAAALVAAATLPAAAATSGSTAVTFALTGGTLDITAPTTGTLASASVSATTVTGQLGAVTVTDNRGVNPASWIATVSSGDFTSGSTTIPASAAAYAAGDLTTTGNPTFGVPTVPSLSNTPVPAVTANPGSGDNSAQWFPTITVTIPNPGAVAGTYAATVTHSVS